MNKKWILPTLYILFLMLPIYGLLTMSFKTTNEILGGFSFFPQQFTLANYTKIFTDPTWYNGYINSLIYVVINTVISVSVALPAAYAFSRYRFLGDKHLFFWLLTNRMAPPAVFALPFFQLYSAIELFDTHFAVALAHCLFNIPLAVWILEGFMSGIPKELDETAYLDGYSFWRFFLRIFVPTIAAGFMGGTTAGENPDVRRRQADSGDDDTNGEYLGLRAWTAGSRRLVNDHTRCDRDLFRAQLYCQGLRPWPGLIRWRSHDGFILDGMDLAHGRVFYRNRLLHHHHGRLGKIQPRRKSAARRVWYRYHPR
jgi:glycerol transport system permease protein